MRKASLLGVLLFLVSMICSCAYVHSPALGIVYTDVKAPLAIDGGSGTVEGQACASSILGLIATGDASIEAAKSNAGISEVSFVDYHSTNILGIYAKYCTIVKGK
jgi:hypothetical protein